MKKRVLLSVMVMITGLFLNNCDPIIPVVDNPVSFNVTGNLTGSAFSGWNICVRQNVNNAYTYFNPDPISETSNFNISLNNVEFGAEFEVCGFYDKNTNNMYDSGTESLFLYNTIISQSNDIDAGAIDISSKTIYIIIDDSANTNGQVYLYGTFNDTNQGYLQKSGNDVMPAVYTMYDDATHGDTNAGDSIYTLAINLIHTHFNYTAKIKFDTNASTYAATLNIPLTNSSIDSVVYSIPARNYLYGHLGGSDYSGWSVFIYDWVKQELLFNTSFESGTNFSIDITSIADGQYNYIYLYKDLNSNFTLDNGEKYFYYTYFYAHNQDTNIGALNINFEDYTITVDDRNNSNSQIYLFGTFWQTNEGVYDTDMNGDVVPTAYLMYDDGLHNDGIAGDHIWGIQINLIAGLNDYVFKFATNTVSGNFLGITNLDTPENPSQFNLDYVMPTMQLSQDVDVLFQVITTNISGTVTLMGVRGDHSPLSWSTTTPLYDDGTHGDMVSGDDIWSAWITFPMNSKSLVEYKYYIGSTPNSGWEDGGNNSFIIDSSSPTQILPVETPDF